MNFMNGTDQCNIVMYMCREHKSQCRIDIGIENVVLCQFKFEY